MKACTFIGHKDAPEEIRPALRSAILEAIKIHRVDTFYVGNHGRFDAMAYALLRELSDRRPITCRVVLAYMPQRPTGDLDPAQTLLPEGIETVPRRFAITFRNKWMIDAADLLIAYVCHPGKSRDFLEYARRRESKGHMQVRNLGTL